MPKKPLASALALVLAVAGLFLALNRKPVEERGATIGGESTRASSGVARHKVDGRVVHFWSEPAATSPAKVTVQPPVLLGAAASAAIAEEAALQMLAREADLDLSPRQWAAFAAATAHIQAVRQAYEASIATVTRSERGHYRVEVPAYPAAGDALRAQFQAELRQQLGENTAAEILEQLGGALEGHFAGFGVSVQTLEFTATTGAENDYQVTRTVQFWNGVDGGEKITTRRETHFPGLEDPSGHTWGPFLAVLAANASARVGG